MASVDTYKTLLNLKPSDNKAPVVVPQTIKKKRAKPSKTLKSPGPKRTKPSKSRKPVKKAKKTKKNLSPFKLFQ